jgi:HSP20 family molecular chaperone IbpA
MDSSNQAQDAAQGDPQAQAAQAAQHGQASQHEQTSQGGTQVGRGTVEEPQAAPAAGQQASGVPERRTDPRVGVLQPPVDVIEDAGGITLIADMPGVARDNLNLRLEAQSLTIEAAMSLDLPAGMEPRHAEVRHQHYERTFALSRELDGEQATAELNHGVLRIRIPKSQEAMPRKIPVNAG